MQSALLELLCCPSCGDRLAPTEQSIQCAGCQATYPVTEGMPVLLPTSATTDITSLAFGRQWSEQDRGTFENDTIYGETAEEELQSFLSRFGIGDPATLAGKRILDIGCGSGRLTQNLSRFAPEALVVGGDRSLAARVAHRRCRDCSNTLIAQLDLLLPPFRPGTFDLVYADGIVPAVPDPEAALASLDRLVRPGGQLFVWIYPRSWSPYRWIRDRLVRPYRFPFALQRTLEWSLGIPLYLAFKLYEPWRGQRRRSFQEVVFTLHDNLAPEFQHRRTVEEMTTAFARLGYVDVRLIGPAVGISGLKRGPEGGA